MMNSNPEVVSTDYDTSSQLQAESSLMLCVGQMDMKRS